ncbi:hypothetical protein QUF80_09090 [Desulfococcaceae bacterium HSG8]|nr:hypothetical protein [Desulfococcaceae bacterium HSG8]
MNQISSFKFQISNFKIACLTLVLIMLSWANNVSAADDTQKHFAISAACGAGSEAILHYNTELGTIERILWGTALGSMPGLTKELIDSTEDGNSFSGSDLTADIVGSFAGALMSNFLNNAINIRVDIRKRKHVRFAFMYDF